MASEHGSTVPDSQETVSDSGNIAPVNLNLSALPPVFITSTHLDEQTLHALEQQITEAGGTITYDLAEARIIISKVLKKRRIQFDLRASGCWTEEVDHTNDKNWIESSAAEPISMSSLGKRKRQERGKTINDAIALDDDSSGSEPDRLLGTAHQSTKTRLPPTPTSPFTPDDIVSVVKLEWLTDSVRAGKPLPLEDYITYQGRRIDPPKDDGEVQMSTAIKQAKPVTALSKTTDATKPDAAALILERAKEDAPKASPTRNRYGKRRFGHNMPSTTNSIWAASHATNQQYANLLHQNTSDNESGGSGDMPEMPEWVKKGVKYACQRLTPRTSPNDDFINLLKKIRVARELIDDDIGVRAYSTSIASLAAYPHKISNPKEILKLPGCDTKIANLFVEWSNTGQIKAVEELEANEELRILHLFYDIWGVGATTAREFYYERGWRDLDDLIEYGWSTLSRVQQIGVKYYDEFLDPIPRSEVESIAKIIHNHACRVRDDKIQSLVVGGYRRGKEASGDVDIIVSHPEESQTLNIVNDIVASLEEEEWITHTLLLSLNGTNRNQQTLPFRTGGGGHGFDTLDKALVVWQDPNWPSKEADTAAAEAAGTKLRNPNIHRRVDIIVSPWRSVGCAVAGWTSGTTFQRDLRRYAKNVKGWKFDSSGVRDRANGEVVDLEEWDGPKGKAGRAKTMEEAEKRVFKGMGLVYREPWERCTG